VVLGRCGLATTSLRLLIRIRANALSINDIRIACRWSGALDIIKKDHALIMPVSRATLKTGGSAQRDSPTCVDPQASNST